MSQSSSTPAKKSRAASDQGSFWSRILPRQLKAFFDCFKIPELRQRIFFTLGLLFVARVGANIPLPGINPLPLQKFFEEAQNSGGLVGLFNMFTGGALSNGAIFALGIMPYISASIILQLMGAVVPSLSRLQQEGEIGRQKITQYTRYLTIGIALVQALLLNFALVNNPAQFFGGFNPEQYGEIIIIADGWFILTSTIFLVTGTIILMWLGEQITQKGIGNGISILITVGILAQLPTAARMSYQLFTAKAGADAALNPAQGLLMGVMFLVVVAGIAAVTQATRRIPVHYAKRVVGRRVMGGQSSFLPLKVNYAGVMPVIFASAIIMFPQFIFSTLGAMVQNEGLQDLLTSINNFLQPTGIPYYIMYGVLIFAFSYFWVSIMFKPIQISDDLKRHGGYIPSVRPGGPTAKYLDHVMTRLTLAGATFLTGLALLPLIIGDQLNIPFIIAQFFGGTSMLIAVGVTLDTMRQVETFLVQRHYDGFLKKGKARHGSKRTRQMVDAGELKNLGALWAPLGVLFAVGIVSWIVRSFVLGG